MTYGSHRRSRTRAPGWFAMACVVAVLALGIVVTPATTVPATATVPGQPGTPQAGTLVFSENFSNTTATSGISILNYVGTGGMTYTALNPAPGSAPGWVPNNGSRSACNGWVLSSVSTPPSSALDPQCTSVLNGSAGTAWSTLGTIADALGQAQGLTAGTNQILSAYTNSTTGLQLAGVQLKTATNTIPVIPGHYYAVSEWYGAVNCFASSDNNLHPRNEGPLAEFDLLDSSGATLTNFGGAVDVCNAPGRQTINGVDVLRVQSPTFQMPAGNTQIGFQLQNLRATGNGNDGGFDLPQIVDVTPQLDKGFSPATIPAGGTSTLTFTVTNTSDLNAKQDWSLTDALPAGLTVANPASVGGTCAASSTVGTAYAVTTAPGATSVSVVGGDLAAGQASCTITVQVTASVPATYTNGPANVTTNLNPPGTATLTVTPTCANPAPIYTVDNGNGVTAAPKLISYDTTGSVLATVPLTTSTGGSLLAPVTDIAMSADGSKLYGIATPLIGTPTLYTFDPATGKATGTIPVTGINWLTFNTPSALSVLPSGKILIGANSGTNSRQLYAIDSTTGVATPYATLPVGYFASGDFLTLPDVTLLVLAGTSASPTTTTLFRYDPVAATFVAVGTVPASTGATQVGTMVYLAGGDGVLRTLGSAAIPATASPAALPTTSLTSLSAGSYLGATSAQDSAPVVCLNVTKTGITVTGPDSSGRFTATYTVKVVNTGTAASYGALTDTPVFSPNIVVDGASSGGVAMTPPTGPFTLAPAGTSIPANTTQSYPVSVTFHYADASAPKPCGGAGTGLYNAVAVPAGQETDKADDSACLTPPANINVVKTAGAVSGPDSSGNYTATYTVTVTNTGGTAGSYGALTDTPAFSPNITMTSASWSGQSTGSATAPASGPFSFTLAPAATTIAAGATQTYTVVVTFHYSDSSQPLACNGPGTGLFNAVVVPAGQETVTTDDAVCLPPPPRYTVYLRKTGKDASGATVALAGSAWRLQADSGGTPGTLIANGVQPVSGQTGEFQMAALAPGSYWLTETTAPTGYVLLAQPIGFVVSAAGAVTVISGGDSAITVGAGPGGQPEIVAGDPSPLKLPLTGGSGTQAFTILGVVLLAAAGIGALVFRRRSASGTSSGRRVKR